jgi:phage-related protein (TIGR01555 family)
MATKNPYLRTPRTAQAARPARGAPPPGAMRRLVEAAPSDPRPLAMRLATVHPVDPRTYTRRERVAASHAMDANGQALNALTFTESTGFPGFPTLALLAQLPEFRAMHERLADECVREWGELTSTGDAPPEKLKAITDELERVELKATIRQLIIHDQAYGRSHPLFKFKNDDNKRDLPLLPKPFSVPKGSFEGVRIVEAYWITPNNYNSIDPSKQDFYKPSSWWMIGQEVHATRLATINSRPVADMLKPTYSFAGVSMTQLAMPYVDNWLRTRQSVSDAVKQYSISGVSTDLSQILAPGAAQDLAARAELINRYRDNRNLMFLDKATEEFFQFNTPLSGLADLQAQAQEQMSAVSHLPLVVLLGITPTGLNASSEGEQRVHEDYVAGYQNNVVSPFVRRTLQFIQLSLFGEIDPGIGWKWHPIRRMTAPEQADADNKNAQTDAQYIEAGVISAQQVAKKLNADPNSRYTGLLDTPEDVHDLPDDDLDGIAEFMEQQANGGPTASAGQAGYNPGGDQPQQPNGSEIQFSSDPGNPDDDPELRALAEGELRAGVGG